MIFYPQPFPQERLIMQAQETQQAAAGSWGAYVDENGVAWWLHNGAKPWANQVYDVSPNTVPQLQLPPQYQQSPTPLQPPRMICPTTAPSVTWAMPSPATFQPTIPSAWIGGGVPVPCYVPVVIRTSDKKKTRKSREKDRPRGRGSRAGTMKKEEMLEEFCLEEGLL